MFPLLKIKRLKNLIQNLDGDLISKNIMNQDLQDFMNLIGLQRNLDLIKEGHIYQV